MVAPACTFFFLSCKPSMLCFVDYFGRSVCIAPFAVCIPGGNNHGAVCPKAKKQPHTRPRFAICWHESSTLAAR